MSRILIVEDDQEIAMLERDYLEIEGFETVLVADGEEAVAAAGARCPVTASLEDDVWFPTKTYDGFALPQGRYTALRVVLGEGAGRNWWCVVFPPLCQSSAEEVQPVLAALGEEDAALLTGESEGYVIKFKAMELWEGLCRWAEGD